MAFRLRLRLAPERCVLRSLLATHFRGWRRSLPLSPVARPANPRRPGSCLAVGSRHYSNTSGALRALPAGVRPSFDPSANVATIEVRYFEADELRNFGWYLAAGLRAMGLTPESLVLPVRGFEDAGGGELEWGGSPDNLVFPVKATFAVKEDVIEQVRELAQSLEEFEATSAGKSFEINVALSAEETWGEGALSAGALERRLAEACKVRGIDSETLVDKSAKNWTFSFNLVKHDGQHVPLQLPLSIAELSEEGKVDSELTALCDLIGLKEEDIAKRQLKAIAQNWTVRTPPAVARSEAGGDE